MSRAALPPLPATVHFVGIGGIGMSGLARILRTWGYLVTGSDATESEQTRSLRAEGIPVVIGHDQTELAAGAALVVITAAVRSGNLEVAAALDRRIPVVKRAELLGMLANARECIAVAGSHGKSTTSGMLVTALCALGRDPSYAVGAVVAATGTNAAPGAGETMVVEADEYDRSFHWLQPAVAIVTNVDYDHPDVYATQAGYDEAYAGFIRKIRPEGVLIAPSDDPGFARVLALDPVAARVRVVRFGEDCTAGWHLNADGSVSTPRGERVRLELAVPGRHNLRNATAALAALDALGIPADQGAAALATFSGVGRRFEMKGDADGVVVVDDYAHHPTEITATLRAARERYPTRRLWAVFQPHTYSRTRAMLAEFATALRPADRVMLLEIYPSRETDDLGVSSSQIADLLPGAIVAVSPAEAAERLAELLEPNDLLVTMGAGDVTTVGPRWLALRRAVEAAR